MSQLFTNNASSTLSVQAEIVHGILTLQSTEGTLFPAPTGGDFFQVSLEDTGGLLEICTCTSRAGDVLTVTRAQENTTAKVFPVGSRVELRFTAATHDSFLQVYGGVMQGEVDMDNNQITDPLIVGGESRGTTMRGTDGGSTNQIIVPTAGGDPTLGSETILHTGNDDAYALKTTTLTGGEGIAALGDLSDNREVELNISELSQINGFGVAHDDEALLFDTSANTHKKMLYRHAGLPVIASGSSTPTPSDGQVNSYWVCTSGSTVSFTLNTTVGQQGNVILVEQGSTGTIDFTAGSATINCAYPNKLTNNQHSVAVLFCTALNVWTLYGDLN